MSHVTWSRPSPAHRSLYFVNSKGKSIVCLVDKPENYPCILLHWIEERRTSAPCEGDGDCMLCATRSRAITATRLACTSHVNRVDGIAQSFPWGTLGLAWRRWKLTAIR